MLFIYCIYIWWLIWQADSLAEKWYSSKSQSVEKVQGSLAELEKTNRNSWRTSMRRGCLITIQIWVGSFWEEQWRPQCFQFVSRETLESRDVYDGLILSQCCTAKSGGDELDARPMLPKNLEFLLQINLVWDLRGPFHYYCSLHSHLLSFKALRARGLIKVTLTLAMAWLQKRQCLPHLQLLSSSTATGSFKSDSVPVWLSFIFPIVSAVIVTWRTRAKVYWVWISIYNIHTSSWQS